MSPEQFETICRLSRFRILRKHQSRMGDILLAERLQPPNENGSVPHWETLWTVARDGCDIGRVVRHPTHENRAGKIILPIPREVTQEQRIKEAVEDAMQWIADASEAGHYA